MMMGKVGNNPFQEINELLMAMAMGMELSMMNKEIDESALKRRKTKPFKSSFVFSQDMFESFLFHTVTNKPTLLKIKVQAQNPASLSKSHTMKSNAVEADLSTNSLFQYQGKICIKLCFPCPEEKCDNKPLHWKHDDCKTINYIDEEGFIFCEESRKGSCQEKYFIQKAEFKCDGGNHHSGYSKYKLSSDVNAALAQAIKSLNNIPSVDLEMKKVFLNNIQENLIDKWD